ncbi:MAG: AbrB/MazE/SpoVT family DNA-binding domain-containing protein [Desulfobacterales bacterium]|nr:AbrB/MazE/SpoVT family DNA-binding domain-containing protein [Desulfobacterales bacterium]
MKPISVTVSDRGYVVLPAQLRKEMKITSGSRILINKKKDKLILEIVPSFTKKLSGLTGKTIGDRPENVDEFIDGERGERLP